MTKTEYIEELKMLFRQHIGEFDVDQGDLKRYLYCPLSCQGYSKNRKGHFEVDYKIGVCYCYRCVEGTSIFSMLLSFKNNENRAYINGLLRVYFDFYEKSDAKNTQTKLEKYQSYDFTVKNGEKETYSSLNFSDPQISFLKRRFPTLEDGEILSVIKEFGFLPVPDGDDFYYYSFFNKFIYLYLYKNGEYVKSKQNSGTVYNDRKDYYYNVNSYLNKNIYMSEGIIDLMTIKTQDPLQNASNSNFLGFCSRNYKFIYEVLLNTGTFFYENVYLVIDNDVNRTSFINGTIRKMCNGKSNPKFKLFKNLYVIEVPKKYLDINDMYIKTKSIKGLIINKII